MPARRPRVALAAMLALAACAEPTGPLADLADGTYALAQVNGVPLPYRVAGDAVGPRSEIVAETLAFRSFGRLRRTRTLRTTDADGQVATLVLRRDTYYRRTDATEVSAPGVVLRIGAVFPCPQPSPLALSVACEPDERAVADGDVLDVSTTFHGAMAAPALVLRFERARGDR